MDEKQLKEIGLNDTQIKTVLSEISTLRTENDKLKERAKGFEAQIKTLEGFKGTNEELTKRLDELKEQRKADADNFKKEMSEFRRDQAIRYAVKSMQERAPYDADLVMSLLDKGKMSVDDKGNLSGFDDQIKALVESKPFLFVAPKEGSSSAPTAPKITGAAPSVGKPIGNAPSFEAAAPSIGARLAQAAQGAQNA